MTIRYVGKGGSDSNNGLTWATRKLTLNGVEDSPVAAGDTVYVGRGVYQEVLTCDVSGSSGNPITYIADVTGYYTDGIGGVVWVTGSDDYRTFTRTMCVDGGSRDYRTFKSFWFGGTNSGSLGSVDVNGGDNWIVEDCVMTPSASHHFRIGSGLNLTLRNIYSVGCGNAFLNASDGTGITNAGHLIENCTVWGAKTYSCLRSSKVGGITVRGGLFNGKDRGAQVVTALPGGYTAINIERSHFFGNSVGVQATATGEIVEDYCNFLNNGTDRTSVTAGSNSTAYDIGLDLPILWAGVRLPSPLLGELMDTSYFARLAGGTSPSVDGFGITRPVTASKRSLGPFQFVDASRETTNVYNGSADSVKLADAGDVSFLMQVESGKSLTLTVRAKWGADYSGASSTLPQLIVKERGQSDRTATATGSAGTWAALTLTFTPATDYITVIFRSHNTATSGDYNVYFDTLAGG